MRKLLLSLARASLLLVVWSIPDISEAGSASPDVAVYQAQTRLTELGYDSGPADGIWGRRTESAIRAFQSDRRLELTSSLDDATRQELGILHQGPWPVHQCIQDYLIVVLHLLNRKSSELSRLAKPIIEEHSVKAASGLATFPESFTVSLGPSGDFTARFGTDWVDPLSSLVDSRGGLPVVVFRNGWAAPSQMITQSSLLMVSDGLEAKIINGLWRWDGKEWRQQLEARPPSQPGSAASGEAVGTLSPWFNVNSPYLLISLEEVRGGFMVLNRDWIAWACDSMISHKVRLTYKTTKVPNWKDPIKLVTSMERVD